MRLDSVGNLGLGVTPSAWNSVYRALQIGSASSFTGRTDQAETQILTNAYRTSTGAYNYIATDFASRLEIANGSYYFFNAPSGTAGNAISFTQAMTLDASGNLLIGQTSTGQQNSNSFSFQPTTGGGGIGIVNHANGSASGNGYFAFAYNATGIGSITQSGTTAVLYNTTSDQRLKEKHPRR